ncbi:MAG TPA: hypothetical protein VMA73_23240 [Streptosporangiaceae bacterium]|nr:hypothetical protein [Streptosporangiaceae bacterium]
MDRVLCEITDITSVNELISYAVRAQLALLEPAASGNAVALAIGMSSAANGAGANLVNALKAGTISDAKLQRLDEVAVVLEPPSLMHTGGLSTLAITLHGYRDRESLSDRVPASWAGEILQGPAESEVGLLTQGSALLAAFLAAERLEQATRAPRAVSNVHDRYYNEIKHVVEQLIILGFAPPTSRSVEALIMLGTLGNYAFDIMAPILKVSLNHPLGFRIWRVITKMVQLSKPRNPYRRSLQAWVRQLLQQAEALRSKSVYTGRSLDLELAINIPSDWVPADDDWVSNALRARAENETATVRERGMAALGLWQRALQSSELNQSRVKADLMALIAEFEDPKFRPDAYQGMQWEAAAIRHLMAREVPVCKDWPQGIDEPWLSHFHTAVGYLESEGVPPYILPATKTLFEHALLQNAEIYRRQAVETLLAGGWTGPVTSALARFLDLEREGAWIRIRALFALGFMQHRDPIVEQAFEIACQAAYDNLSNNPSQAQIHEMHAALFAVGDCYGATGVAEEEVRRVREGIRNVLTGIIDRKLTVTSPLFSVSRAAAYALTFMVLPRKNKEMDLAEELLQKLLSHPDEVTRELSKWGLENRLGENGQVLPLVLAKI